MGAKFKWRFTFARKKEKVYFDEFSSTSPQDESYFLIIYFKLEPISAEMQTEISSFSFAVVIAFSELPNHIFFSQKRTILLVRRQPELTMQFLNV